MILFFKKVAIILRSLRNFNRTVYMLNMANQGYLYDRGWIQSYSNKSPVNNFSEPLPWYTMSFIDFLNERLKPTLKVFEYGCGNSTLFFSKRTFSVDSIENSQEWFDSISLSLKNHTNVNVCFQTLGESYVTAPTMTKKKYDIIVIDGRLRLKCLKESLKNVNESGIIILDNSDRVKYRDAFEIMDENQYRHIGFWGMALGSSKSTCTTLFYKSKNCFNI